MFKSQPSADEPSHGSAETIIGPAVHVEGDLKAVGNVQVEGSLNGTLTTDKDLRIGEKAKITATINAQSATIAGKIEGKIQLSGHLTLKPTAHIIGDISTSTISIENGAKLNGQLHMGEEKPSAQNPVAKDEQKREASSS